MRVDNLNYVADEFISIAKLTSLYGQKAYAMHEHKKREKRINAKLREDRLKILKSYQEKIDQVVNEKPSYEINQDRKHRKENPIFTMGVMLLILASMTFVAIGRVREYYGTYEVGIKELLVLLIPAVVIGIRINRKYFR